MYKNAAPRDGRHSQYHTFSKATGALLVQYPPTREQPACLSSERRTNMSFADRQKSPKRFIHLRSSAPATQRREAWPATHLMPSERSGIWLCTTGPFQGLQFLIGCNIRHLQAAGPPAYPTREDSCVVLCGRAPTSR
jgi:hypothetical protein